MPLSALNPLSLQKRERRGRCFAPTVRLAEGAALLAATLVPIRRTPPPEPWPSRSTERRPGSSRLGPIAHRAAAAGRTNTITPRSCKTHRCKNPELGAHGRPLNPRSRSRMVMSLVAYPNADRRRTSRRFLQRSGKWGAAWALPSSDSPSSTYTLRLPFRRWHTPIVKIPNASGPSRPHAKERRHHLPARRVSETLCA